VNSGYVQKRAKKRKDAAIEVAEGRAWGHN